MQYRPLGRTGVQVSALCLGTMNFGDDCNESDSIEIVHRALDEGINFIDTADMYSQGISEEITGKALQGANRSRAILATKVYNRMGDGVNSWGSHRNHIIEGCNASLKRLGTDYIDLYQLHRPQPDIPIDETLRALDDLVRAGKVRYIGTSTFAAWQITDALWASKELRLNRFVTEQPPYNLLDRRVERELIPMCQTYGIGILPWAPLAGGLLTGKYKAGQDRPVDARYASKTAPMNRDHEAALAKVQEYVAWCGSEGLAPADVALAWVLQQPGVTSPIIGPKSMQQYAAYMSAATLVLTDAQLQAIDAIFPPGTHISNYYSANFGPNARW
jgi:aryl-alcohol dehydrogenase-like predicted oxidoreductase